MLLTVREIAELTGRERRSAQCRALDAMGVPYRVRPDGSPAVLRTAAEAALGHASPQNRPPSPELRLPAPA